MDIITGEKIQKSCNVYIGNNRAFSGLRSNMYKDTRKLLFIDDKKKSLEFINKINENKKNIIIFIYTHILHEYFSSIIKVLKLINFKFNLVLHNSDNSFEEKHLKLFEINNLNKIFTQNLNVNYSEKIIPIPIGIANSQWPHGDLNSLNRILSILEKYKKNKTFYLNFRIKNNRKKRNLCYEKIKKSKFDIEEIPKLEYPEYLKCLVCYKFAICPEGNGLDTHRFWECLYLKVIPVCLKNQITIFYNQYFPILLLNHWDEINNINIDEIYNNADWKNYHLLNFSTLTNKFDNFT